jgi:hypothetical protein
VEPGRQGLASKKIEAHDRLVDSRLDKVEELDSRRRDLDPADLDEVRRRVVDPVLAALFRAGEVTDVHVSSARVPDSWSAFGESDDGPWLQLSVGAEDFIHPIAKAGFWLDDAEWVAADLVDKLSEWICESRFGWGELRSLPDGWAVPPPLAGRSAVSVHFADEEDGFPLWAGGAPAPWLEQRLSASLVADLRAWQALGVQLANEAEAAEAPAPDRNPESPVGVWVKYVSEQSWFTRQAEEGKALAKAQERRRTWIDALEPLRDELVARLRAELSPDFEVLSPPRV